MTWKRAARYYLLGFIPTLLLVLGINASFANAATRAQDQATLNQWTPALISWIERTTGTDIPNRPVVIADKPLPLPGREPAAGWVLPGTTYLSADAAREVAHFLRHRGTHGWDTYSVHVYLHELLHRGAEYGNTEEMATEAMTVDLFPAFIKRVTGDPYPWKPIIGYPELTNKLRAQSAKATGTSVNSRGARIWRRAFWAGGPEKRAAMLTQPPAAPRRPARRPAATVLSTVKCFEDGSCRQTVTAILPRTAINTSVAVAIPGIPSHVWPRVYHKRAVTTVLSWCERGMPCERSK